uniref:Uncharacterized protein n=2 Tax=Amphimedon queenslandica TaxID=400682 RepID=A0A1X7UFQ7_AMPQE
MFSFQNITVRKSIPVTTTDTPSNYITVSTISSIAISDTTSLSSVMGTPSSSSMTRYTTTTTITAVPTNSITTASISITSSLSTTMTSTPGQGNAGNGASTILIAAISAVIVLLVVTNIGILIVSVLVCRRRLYKTTNGNDTFSSDERKADINQQSDIITMDKGQNILLASTNPAYGVIGEQDNCNTGVSANPAYGITERSGVSANPAYGINTRGIENIDQVYDEPRTMMHNEQEDTMATDEAHQQMKEEEEELYI